jgi:hypothetical protein
MAAGPILPAMRGLAIGVIVALIIFAAVDFLGTRRADIRSFDPAVVAVLDTKMWRSQYERRPERLFFELAELMRRQFQLPILRSYLVAFHASRASFLFKEGRTQSEYEKALPELVSYYSAINKISTRRFDVQRAAKAELAWWIVHRERAQRGGGDLERALAEAAAALYGGSAGSFREYARERAEAMEIRDGKAKSGALREGDWKAIYDHLHASWSSLHDALHAEAA